MSTALPSKASADALVQTDASSSKPPAPSAIQAEPAEIAVLRQIQHLLDENRPDEALRLIPKKLVAHPLFKNAQCVCWMRLGQFESAVRGLRQLCVTPQLSLRTDVPPHFKTNFATALLLSGNTAGYLSAIRDIGERDFPEMKRLQSAVQNWENSLPILKRVLWRLGVGSAFPASLPVPPGVVMLD